MISPHPSYPPLEMSTHGVKTITNSFSNKDLSNFNEFIVSLDTIGSMDIANKLFEIVNNYNDGNVTLDLNEKYISNNLEFDNLTKYISEIIS